jgi:methyl-accepting chemotaxis protein
MKNLGLRTKLFILSGILLFMCALTGFTGYYITKNVITSYQKIDELNLPKIEAILSAQSSNRTMRLQLWRLLAQDLPKEGRDDALKRYKQEWEKYDKFIKNYLDTAFAPGEKELYEVLSPKIKEMHELTDKAVETFKNLKNDNDVEGKKKLDQLIMVDLEKLIVPFRNAQDDIIKFNQDATVVNSKEAHAARDVGSKMLMAMVFSSLIFGFLCAYMLSSSLVRVFKEITTVLTIAGNEVAGASEQVAASSEELSSAVQEQSAAIQETASSLDELSSAITKNTDIAVRAASSSKRTQESANHGKSVVQEMITSMVEINESNSRISEQVHQNNQKIEEIVKVITEIGNKTKVINDIVFQTKLLSFNASVEAARSGEHGKGFAVVAEEVGNLARMSGEAATEITSMLDASIIKVTNIAHESQSKVNSIITEGKVKVDKGSNIAHECGVVFEKICEDITFINTMSNEISSASVEQKNGVLEIAKAMGQVDVATQQNAAVSHQASASAEELSAQAQSMKMAVNQLIKIVSGAKIVNQTINAPLVLKKRMDYRSNVEMKAS